MTTRKPKIYMMRYQTFREATVSTVSRVLSKREADYGIKVYTKKESMMTLRAITRGREGKQAGTFVSSCAKEPSVRLSVTPLTDWMKKNPMILNCMCAPASSLSMLTIHKSNITTTLRICRCQTKYLTSRHERMHTVILYIWNTLRKLMIRALGIVFREVCRVQVWVIKRKIVEV